MKYFERIKIALVVMIFISFFLPWVSVESGAVGGVRKLLMGKKQATIQTISGFEVPILANSDKSRFMISVIKIFNPKVQNADKKSFLIWIVPLLAIAIFFALKYFKDKKTVRLGISILCILIFIIATFKIVTADLDKLLLSVNISYGLWLVLIGYLGLGLVEILDIYKINFLKQ